MKLANRMQSIEPFYVMALLGRAKELEAEGVDVIHLEVGEPDFPSPAAAIKAGVDAMASGLTHYTPATGLPELKNKIASFYDQRYGVKLDPYRVVVTPGSSGGLQAVIALLVNPGEKVLLTDPGYPCNRHFVTLYGGIAKSIAVSAKEQFQFSSEIIRANWDASTRAVLMASPSNPTGTVVSEDALVAIANTVSSLEGILIVDEIYHGLAYDGSLPTVLQFSDEAFAINSFSKYFGMTGWRIGWIIAPESAVPGLEKLCQNMFLAPPTVAQYGAMASLGSESLAELENRRDEFKLRRDYLEPALTSLGFVIPAPSQGAFYIYADISAFSQDSYQFCIDLLEKTGVAITPGIDFGVVNASRYVRFAYTTTVPRLQEAVSRIEHFISSL